MDLLMVPQVDLDVVIGGHSHTLLFGDENGDLEGFDEQDEEDNIKGWFENGIFISKYFQEITPRLKQTLMEKWYQFAKLLNMENIWDKLTSSSQRKITDMSSIKDLTSV